MAGAVVSVFGLVLLIVLLIFRKYTDGSYRHNKALWVQQEQITITTDASGIAEISGYHLPIAVENYGFVMQFFNGASNGFKYYVQVKDYSGNPIANQTITFVLYYIPDFTTLVSS